MFDDYGEEEEKQIRARTMPLVRVLMECLKVCKARGEVNTCERIAEALKAESKAQGNSF